MAQSDRQLWRTAGTPDSPTMLPNLLLTPFASLWNASEWFTPIASWFDDNNTDSTKQQPQPRTTTHHPSNESVVRTVPVRGTTDYRAASPESTPHKPAHHTYQPAYQTRHTTTNTPSPPPTYEQRAIQASLESAKEADTRVQEDERRLYAFLRKHNLKITAKSAQPRDGNCWAGALAFACRHQKIHHLLHVTHQIVRKIAVESLRQNVDWYLPFFTPNTTTSQKSTPEEADAIKRELFLEETEEMLRPCAWQSQQSNIGDLLVDAFARGVGVCIRRYGSDGSVLEVGPSAGQKTKLAKDENSHMLLVAYVDTPHREHYHGVEQMDESDFTDSSTSEEMPAPQTHHHHHHQQHKNEGYNTPEARSILAKSRFANEHARLAALHLTQHPHLNEELLQQHRGNVDVVADRLNKLRTLESMGFECDADTLLAVLEQKKGDIREAAAALVRTSSDSG